MEITGRILEKKIITTNKGKTLFTTNGLNNGLYFIIIESESDKIWQSKISIQK